jgi:hypothetical protein
MDRKVAHLAGAAAAVEQKAAADQYIESHRDTRWFAHGRYKSILANSAPPRRVHAWNAISLSAIELHAPPNRPISAPADQSTNPINIAPRDLMNPKEEFVI